MSEQQWYRVERTDGNVQYATKTEGGYLLWGSGFVIKKFDKLQSLTKVDEVPTNIKHGYAFFEGMSFYKAYHDANHWWNGWACPWIHKDDVKRLVEEMNDGGSATRFVWNGDNIDVYWDQEYEEPQDKPDGTIELQEDGYYYWGGEGLCFDFMNDKELERYEFNIESPDGITIHMDNFPTLSEALNFYNEWKKRFEAQGYYSANSRKIDLGSIDWYCKVNWIKK